MRVTFLGTGTSQGVPVIACQCDVCRSNNSRDKRLRSSVLIEKGEQVFVIDSGPDFRQQMLNADVRKLDAVLITHGHKDHTGGLDDVRSFNFLQREPMRIFALNDVLNDIRREFSYAFASDRYPGVPRFDLREIGAESFEIDGTQIIPLPVMHGKMPVLGFRIGSFSYVTDASHIPDQTMALLKDSEVLVLNALRKEEHYTHFNLEEALDVIRALNPGRAYLTHIGHLMGREEDISPTLPANVEFAWDDLQLNL